MTQFIIQADSCTDGNGNNVPRRIGPFPTRNEAHDLGTSIIRNGSWTITPLTAPAVAKALAAEVVRQVCAADIDHENRCCRIHGTHVSPHRGCILR